MNNNNDMLKFILSEQQIKQKHISFSWQEINVCLSTCILDFINWAAQEDRDLSKGRINGHALNNFTIQWIAENLPHLKEDKDFENGYHQKTFDQIINQLAEFGDSYYQDLEEKQNANN